MSAYHRFRKAMEASGDSASVLAACATYLEESADWPEVRDALFYFGLTDDQILWWFSTQDFPDFAEAVNEGWGWGTK